MTLYKFLLTQPGRVIVFVNHVSSVRALCAMLQVTLSAPACTFVHCLQRRPRACCGRVTVVCLQLLDVPARPLHAGLQQRQRLKHLDKFSESDAGVLVATDVAARGLDIPDVRAVRRTHASACPAPASRASADCVRLQVVHYNVPPSVDAYVHRSGRTARAAADGVSLCLIGNTSITRPSNCTSLPINDFRTR